MAIEKKMLISPKILNFRKHPKYVILGGFIVLSLMAVAIINTMPLSGKLLTLHPQDFKKGFTEQGQIIAAEEWPVFNQVDGKLQSLKVNNGDSVKKGQVLFEISSSN